MRERYVMSTPCGDWRMARVSTVLVESCATRMSRSCATSGRFEGSRVRRCVKIACRTTRMPRARLYGVPRQWASRRCRNFCTSSLWQMSTTQRRQVPQHRRARARSDAVLGLTILRASAGRAWCALRTTTHTCTLTSLTGSVSCGSSASLLASSCKIAASVFACSRLQDT